jgi:hypothetical protein
VRLETGGGSSLRLSIVGYQFPHAPSRLLSAVGVLSSADTDFDFDANWLVVQGEVSDGHRAWTFRDACLLTVEVRDLAAWLDAVAEGRPNLEDLDFLEPNLAFSRRSTIPGRPAVRVTFRLEARPPWMTSPVEDEDDWDGAWVEFETSPDHLRTAATDLRAALSRYPIR